MVGPGGCLRIVWAVPASKAKSAHRIAVSPAFGLPLSEGSSATKFSLMLLPGGGGGCSFKKSNGISSIQLKCQADACLPSGASTLAYRFFIGSECPRGPVSHDFTHRAICGLPREIESW